MFKENNHAMQCPNCSQQIMQAGSQFCPFCGSPLNISAKPKVDRQKRSLSAKEGFVNWRFIGVALLVGSLLAVCIMGIVAYPNNNWFFLIVGAIIGIVAVGICLRHQCENCKGFFTLRLLSRERIDGKKVYKMLHGKYSQQIVVLRVTWKDHLQCSYCEQKYDSVYEKDYKSFSE
jgi:hypothetical protein